HIPRFHRYVSDTYMPKAARNLSSRRREQPSSTPLPPREQHECQFASRRQMLDSNNRSTAPFGLRLPLESAARQCALLISAQGERTGSGQSLLQDSQAPASVACHPSKSTRGSVCRKSCSPKPRIFLGTPMDRIAGWALG